LFSKGKFKNQCKKTLSTIQYIKGFSGKDVCDAPPAAVNIDDGLSSMCSVGEREGQKQEAEEEASLPGLLPCTPGLLPAGYTILF
jgi:hypothetical protein